MEAPNDVSGEAVTDTASSMAYASEEAALAAAAAVQDSQSQERNDRFEEPSMEGPDDGSGVPGADAASSVAYAAAEAEVEAASATEGSQSQKRKDRIELPSMETPNDVSRVPDGDTTSSLAFAAAEGVAEAEEASEVTEVCRICGKEDEGRQMVRFHPVQVDATVASLSPSVTTFSEDITVHVFCGKTASILPQLHAPQYEILSKAGIKNKHGTGAEVSAALARTRCAIVASPAAKDKYFYLVQEFEANLAGVRAAYLEQRAYPQIPELTVPMMGMYAQPQEQQFQHAMLSHETHTKPIPVKAAAGYVHKPGSHQTDIYAAFPPAEVSATSDGKIRCPCGGTHLPAGSAKGAASWRSHVLTKRHQDWMEANGLLGAV